MTKRRELFTIVPDATPPLVLLAVCFWLTSLDFGDYRREDSAVTYVLWALSTCVVLGAVALGFQLFRNLLKLYIEHATAWRTPTSEPGSFPLLMRQSRRWILALRERVRN